MNIVDIVIVIALIFAVQRGIRVGLLRLFLSAVGFIVGLYLGSLIAGAITGHVADNNTRMLLGLGLNLFCAFLGASIGEIIGIELDAVAQKIHLDAINNILGAAFEVLFTLLLVWLIASPLANITTGNIGRLVQRSAIVTALNATLPAPPDLLSELQSVISANGFPQVFLGREPNHQTIISTATINTPAVQAAEQSVVKIQGYGCGGIVEGSGFVSGKGFVVTNAHVVAGVSEPRVVANGKSYSATPIWFDQNMDLVVLSVPRLPTPPLTIADVTESDKSAVVIMGYPGGGPLTVGDGVIIDHITAVGRNIYNRGVVSRQIYEVQGSVVPGNSGGPLVDDKGNVVGLVFAKSVTNDNVGYALLTHQLLSAIQQASSSQTPVATGRCAVS